MRTEVLKQGPEEERMRCVRKGSDEFQRVRKWKAGIGRSSSLSPAGNEPLVFSSSIAVSPDVFHCNFCCFLLVSRRET